MANHLIDAFFTWFVSSKLEIFEFIKDPGIPSRGLNSRKKHLFSGNSPFSRKSILIESLNPVLTWSFSSFSKQSKYFCAKIPSKLPVISVQLSSLWLAGGLFWIFGVSGGKHPAQTVKNPKQMISRRHSGTDNKGMNRFSSRARNPNRQKRTD